MAIVNVDCDGVIYDFKQRFMSLVVSTGMVNVDVVRYGTTDKWDFYSGWGWTDEHFVLAFKEFILEHELFRHGYMREDAAHQLRRLQEAGHIVNIVTDRAIAGEGIAKIQTRAWLKANNILNYDELYITADKTSVPADYFIDDKIENYDAIRQSSCTDVFLLDRPWNEEEGDLRQRVSSLKNFVDHVLEVEESIWRNDKKIDEFRVTSSTGGMKGSKDARYSLLPPDALRQLSEHYNKGTKKYSDHNWQKGYDWHLSYDALQRHANQFWGGEDFDEETGSHHMAAVAFHALALITFFDTHPEFDDRPHKVLGNG